MIITNALLCAKQSDHTNSWTPMHFVMIISNALLCAKQSDHTNSWVPMHLCCTRTGTRTTHNGRRDTQIGHHEQSVNFIIWIDWIGSSIHRLVCLWEATICTEVPGTEYIQPIGDHSSNRFTINNIHVSLPINCLLLTSEVKTWNVKANTC